MLPTESTEVEEEEEACWRRRNLSWKSSRPVSQQPKRRIENGGIYGRRKRCALVLHGYVPSDGDRVVPFGVPLPLLLPLTPRAAGKPSPRIATYGRCSMLPKKRNHRFPASGQCKRHGSERFAISEPPILYVPPSMHATGLLSIADSSPSPTRSQPIRSLRGAVWRLPFFLGFRCGSLAAGQTC
jgi:hypothetical protein